MALDHSSPEALRAADGKIIKLKAENTTSAEDAALAEISRRQATETLHHSAQLAQKLAATPPPQETYLNQMAETFGDDPNQLIPLIRQSRDSGNEARARQLEAVRQDLQVRAH